MLKKCFVEEIGFWPHIYFILAESPLAAEPKRGDLLFPCQPSYGIRMKFKVLTHFLRSIYVKKSTHPKISPLKLFHFITYYTEKIIKNFAKIAKMSLKTGCWALSQSVLFDVKFCLSPTENVSLITYSDGGSPNKLTWTRFFEPTITRSPRLARPAPRPPFQGPVSLDKAYNPAIEDLHGIADFVG